MYREFFIKINSRHILGFEGEVRVKYGELSYELFCEVFCYLPLAHVINNKVYVVHGGLFSQDGITLPQIRKIPRVCEPPIEGKSISRSDLPKIL